MERLCYIEMKYKNNNFKKVIKELEKYMMIPKNGIYDELLDMYIKSLIRMGLYDDALIYIDLMQKCFPNFYSQYTLANRYANCSENEKLEDILRNNQFSNEEYYIIATICFYNGNISLAKTIFEKLIKLENVGMKYKIKEYLEKIRLFERKADIAFQRQSYSYFKNCGYTLEPGHVIYVSKLRLDYKENWANDDPKKNERPYMIWKIEGDLLYAFPVTTQSNKYQYTFYSQNYAEQHPDRTLKDRLAVIRQCDITVVDDKINEKDFKEAMLAMYRSTFFSCKGEYPISIKYFMDETLRNMRANIGDVIIVNDFNTHKKIFYFVSDIDELKEKHKVFEIDYSFKPEGNYLQLGYIDLNMPILDTFSIQDDGIKQELLSLKPSTFDSDNMVGIIFNYGNRKLEILEETPESFICIDVTNGYLPEIVEVVFIPKNVSIFNISLIPEELLKEQQKLFEEYKRNNSEEFANKSDELKRMLIKKEK